MRELVTDQLIFCNLFVIYVQEAISVGSGEHWKPRYSD